MLAALSNRTKKGKRHFMGKGPRFVTGLYLRWCLWHSHPSSFFPFFHSKYGPRPCHREIVNDSCNFFFSLLVSAAQFDFESSYRHMLVLVFIVTTSNRARAPCTALKDSLPVFPDLVVPQPISFNLCLTRGSHWRHTEVYTVLYCTWDVLNDNNNNIREPDSVTGTLTTLHPW